jgi:hypothetical protein
VGGRVGGRSGRERPLRGHPQPSPAFRATRRAYLRTAAVR